MKKAFFISLIIAASGLKALGQEKFNVNDFAKYVGKKATLCDTVASYKILNDTVTMLNMGANFPNQNFIVVVSGREITLNFDDIKGKHLCVTGDVSKYNGKPEVLIYHVDQLVFK